MAVSYEWDVERVDTDGDEILDHDHRARLSEYTVDVLGSAIRRDLDMRLVLVRDGDNCDRGWAYVVNGELPENFLDANDDIIAPVPARFRQELNVARLEIHTKSLAARETARE